MKKLYCSPYLSIVSVKNDIIATSEIPVGGSGPSKAAGHGIFDVSDEADEYYLW